jgi:hypothetical protein
MLREIQNTLIFQQTISTFPEQSSLAATAVFYVGSFHTTRGQKFKNWYFELDGAGNLSKNLFTNFCILLTMRAFEENEPLEHSIKRQKKVFSTLKNCNSWNAFKMSSGTKNIPSKSKVILGSQQAEN